MAKSSKKGRDESHIIARNRRARFLYTIVDTFEAGMILIGPEVKSLREGRVNLGDAYATVRRGECFLHKLCLMDYWGLSLLRARQMLHGPSFLQRPLWSLRPLLTSSSVNVQAAVPSSLRLQLRWSLRRWTVEVSNLRSVKRQVSTCHLQRHLCTGQCLKS